MKKLTVIFLFFIMLLLGNTSCMADVKQSGIELVDLTFEQAYQLMLENNNSLKAYNELIEQSKYEKRAALGEFSPKVFLNSTYIHFSEDLQLTTTIPGVTSIPTRIQDQNLFTFGGGVVWNIFTGGKILSNHAAARAKLEASNAKYREVKDSLTVDLITRYYGLCLAHEVADVRLKNLECIEQHLKDAKLLEKEGLISKSERLHAEVAYSDAKRDYKSSLRDITITEEALKSLIKAENVNLNDVRIAPNTGLFMFKDFSVDVKEMKASAMKNNPQLQQLADKRKIMDAKYHAKNAEYLPTVSLFATDIFAASHLSEAMPRGTIGGMANWMIFDGLKRENTSLAIKHERKMVDYEIEDAKYKIEALITQKYNELMKNKERYDSSVEALESAEESLRVANLSFKEGCGTSLQVTDAQMMLLKVKTDRLNSIYKFDVALAELLKANGDMNDFMQYVQNNNIKD